jgi:DNA-binding response OmpR family regulator
MELKTGPFYECGPFRLEPTEHRLTREGNPVSLAPKAFELLVFMFQNQGRLVTKDQIMQAVWPGSLSPNSRLRSPRLSGARALSWRAPELRVSCCALLLAYEEWILDVL